MIPDSLRHRESLGCWSGGPSFKPSSLLLTGFVFSSSEFNSLTALSMKPTSQLGFLKTLCLSQILFLFPVCLNYVFLNLLGSRDL